MSLAFYADEHIPAAIKVALRRRGVDVLAVAEDSRDGRPDSELLDHAGVLGRLVLTSDSDFLRLAHHRLSEGALFAGIVYLQVNRMTIGHAVDDLALIAECGSPEEFRSRVLFLPL